MMTYDDSETVCDCHRGQLALPDSKKHNMEIALMAPTEGGTYQQIWLGYTDRKKQSVYLDRYGHYPKYPNWGTGSTGLSLPDNGVFTNFDGVLESQDCVTMNFRMRSLWDDDWCSILHYGACQRDRK